MKKLIALMTAAAIFVTVGSVSAASQNDTSEKELCLLYAQDCATKVYNLQEKIRKIQDEIAKGATVYNADELKKLKDKLKEAEDMMEKLAPTPSPLKVTK